MEKNVIYSDKEYMAQGFSATEVPLIRRHDLLHNKWSRGGELSPRQQAEYAELQKRLGL